MEHFEVELMEKEKVLKANINEIAHIDEAILLIDDQQKQLQLERNTMELNNSAMHPDNESDSTNIDINGNKTNIYDHKTSENYIPTEIDRLNEQTSNLSTTENQEGMLCA